MKRKTEFTLMSNARCFLHGVMGFQVVLTGINIVINTMDEL